MEKNKKQISKKEFEAFMKENDIFVSKRFTIKELDFDIDDIENLSQLTFTEVPKFECSYMFYNPKYEQFQELDYIMSSYDEEFETTFKVRDNFHIEFYDDLEMFDKRLSKQ